MVGHRSAIPKIEKISIEYWMPSVQPSPPSWLPQCWWLETCLPAILTTKQKMRRDLSIRSSEILQIKVPTRSQLWSLQSTSSTRLLRGSSPPLWNINRQLGMARQLRKPSNMEDGITNKTNCEETSYEGKRKFQKICTRCPQRYKIRHGNNEIRTRCH